MRKRLTSQSSGSSEVISLVFDLRWGIRSAFYR